MLKIRDLRQEKGWTQKKLAEKINSSNKNVWAWENNVSSPDIEMLIMLSKVFDVSVDYLIGRTDDFGNTMQSTNAETLSSDEQRLLRCYRALGDVERRAILTTAESLNNQKGQSVRKTN